MWWMRIRSKRSIICLFAGFWNNRSDMYESDYESVRMLASYRIIDILLNLSRLKDWMRNAAVYSYQNSLSFPIDSI